MTGKIEEVLEHINVSSLASPGVKHFVKEVSYLNQSFDSAWNQIKRKIILSTYSRFKSTKGGMKTGTLRTSPEDKKYQSVSVRAEQTLPKNCSKNTRLQTNFC